MPKRTEFVTSRFVLAEGFEDAQFTREIIATRNLAAFDVSPNDDVGDVSGHSGFEDALIKCEPITGFTSVTNVVILADNDDDPAASFTQVTAQIERARRENNIKRDWRIPAQPAVKAAGNPSVAIWMWPSVGQQGCLETLLWQVVQRIHAKEAACVDDACRCAGADQWPISKRDKARVRCFLSLVVKRNPAVTLGSLWRDHKKLIPVLDAAFDPFATFLASI